MSWNYRLVKTEDGFGVFEVYYDDAGRPNGTSARPVFDFFCETPEAILHEIEVIKAAWDLPALDMDSSGTIARDPAPEQNISND